MEIVIKYLLFKSLFNISTIYIIVYVAFISLILTLVTKLFSEKINRLIMYLFLVILSIWFSAQFICKDYFDFYISWNIFLVADQMNDFLDKCVVETLKRIGEILIIFLPFFVVSLIGKRIDFNKAKFKENFIYIILIIIKYFIFIGLFKINKNNEY